MNNKLNFCDFKYSVMKINKSRHHKVNNSHGVYEAFCWLRKNKWLNLKRPVNEHEYYSIIRSVNNYLADNLVNGNVIKFPCKMGEIVIKKFPACFNIVDGKVKTNLPVDWHQTLKLWYEDENAYKEKALIKCNKKEMLKVCYDRSKADFNNKNFYVFFINRELKNRIKNSKKEGLDFYKG